MSENERNWLWIIPDWNKTIWDICKEENLLVMAYVEGNRNITLGKQIVEGDQIIVYLNQNTIGGICVSLGHFVKANKYYRIKDIEWQERTEWTEIWVLPIRWKYLFENGFSFSKYPEGLIGIPSVQLKNQTIHKMDDGVSQRFINFLHSHMCSDEDELF